MKIILLNLSILALITSCQSTSKPTTTSHYTNSSEAYQAQIKADKKKQAELDLPFRGFSVSDKTLQTIAFSSGLTQNQQMPTWSAIEKNKPELMIMTWNPDKNLSTLPDYRSLREKVPAMAVCSNEDISRQKELQVEFLKNWPYAKTIIPENQDGTYHSKVFGTKKNQVQVIVLDQCDNEKQWTWLESELKRNVALKIITVSSNGHEKVIELLKKTGTKNVVLISNDQALTGIEKNKIKNVGTILEATSNVANSSMLNVSSPISDVNFGLIHINWANRSALIEIVSGKNEKVQSSKFSF
jgi:uncharacterized protein YceK